MFFCSTGRDGTYKFPRQGGTVHNFFHDRKGRYFFFSTGRDGTFCFHDGTGRYAYFFTAAQESAMQERTALGTKAAGYKLYVVHWYFIIIISYFNISNYCLDTTRYTSK